MKKIALSLAVMLSLTGLHAQHKQAQNLVIVTLDGMRWEEVFGGADSALIHAFTEDPKEEEKKWWVNDANARRSTLFPFLWSEVVAKGQLFGNRNKGSYVNVTNPYRFSYPGYNEIFTGYPDTAVNSNDKVLNKNTNVLEFINKQKGFEGKVAAFTTWDVFPYILNAQRSGIYVNTDTDTLAGNAAVLKLTNDFQRLAPRPIGVRPDVITYLAAREYLKANKPRVLYIAFDETDDFAHGGLYDQYLKAAHAEDAMIADIWHLLQSTPGYANNTVLLVTCDHGRGDKIKKQWRDHGAKVEDADQIWMAAMGPGIKPLGEDTHTQLYQRQLAPTMAALLGFDFVPAHPVVKPVSNLLEQ
ncbi:alkaline phosphatase family protein [Deminuibacter soli]|uniref:Phosphoglyceromutase n=1 Tax=Deminuibacter soli TaxID=2291815 RepID=A0A3E1NDI4_9BACT|nr:alkaline phosphatase family protein [Deminuibacter soli]RFM26029.1 phosphoglyceromutase [Deminuibacter soli]